MSKKKLLSEATLKVMESQNLLQYAKHADEAVSDDEDEPFNTQKSPEPPEDGDDDAVPLELGAETS